MKIVGRDRDPYGGVPEYCLAFVTHWCFSQKYQVLASCQLLKVHNRFFFAKYYYPHGILVVGAIRYMFVESFGHPSVEVVMIEKLNLNRT